MNLNIADISIIVDTLHGSLSFCDDGKLFMFTRKARQVLLEKIIKQSSELGLTIAPEKNKDEQPAETPPPEKFQ